MIKLGKLTEYSIVTLTLAAKTGDDRTVTARSLAERSEIPLPTVSKVLKILSKAGFLVSQRGAAGGYALSRAPNEISILEIIEAVEGTIALTSCCEGGFRMDACYASAHCPIRGRWTPINDAVRVALGKLTLAEFSSGSASR